MKMGKKKSNGFKMGDKVVLLSMTSTTPAQPTIVFTVTGRADESFLYAEALTPEGNHLSCMRTDACFIPAHVVRYKSDSPYHLGEGSFLSKGILLTVREGSGDYYLCFETSNLLIPKELVEDVDLDSIGSKVERLGSDD